MMYGNKLATAIKVNGKVLREFKDTVYIPFGSEYSILIKNLHTTRALIHVFIDGEDQTPDGLVINNGKEIEFERSLKNRSLTEGNKFKFIERTGSIEQHRGIKLEDGIVRIEYQFESPVVRNPIWQVQDHYYNGLKVGTSANPLTVDKNWIGSVNNVTTGGAMGMATGGGGGGFNVNGVLRNVDYSKGEMTNAVASAATQQYCADNGISHGIGELHDGVTTMNCSFNDAGITVSGSKSTQSFSTTYMGVMDPEKFSMVIKLLGETPDNKPVLKSVTVKHKPKCTTCGKQNKATAKFCTECGTHLTIYA